jgi:hypothetical protein
MACIQVFAANKCLKEVCLDVQVLKGFDRGLLHHSGQTSTILVLASIFILMRGYMHACMCIEEACMRTCICCCMSAFLLPVRSYTHMYACMHLYMYDCTQMRANDKKHEKKKANMSYSELLVQGGRHRRVYRAQAIRLHYKGFSNKKSNFQRAFRIVIVGCVRCRLTLQTVILASEKQNMLHKFSFVWAKRVGHRPVI